MSQQNRDYKFNLYNNMNASLPVTQKKLTRGLNNEYRCDSLYSNHCCSLFKKFTLRDGDIDWNNYELCFPIEDIYQGTL